MTDQNFKQYFIRGTVERFVDKDAVIVLESGVEVRWPIVNLPDNVEVGTDVRLVLSTAENEEAERQQVAKTILNEVLNTQTDNDKQKSNS